MKTVHLLTIATVIVTCSAVENPNPDAIVFPSDDSSERTVNPRMNYHSHHYHHHDHHFDDKLIGNKSIATEVETSPKEIPLSFIQELNEVDDVSMLLNYLDGEEKIVEEIGISTRFGSVERAAATIPKLANCIPTPQTISLKESSNDSSLFYFPSCTRVDRCGGCCSHSLISCQPTQVETVSFQVIVSQYTGGTKLTVRGKEIVLVDKHIKCRCQCKIKKEDCNSFQEYRSDECRCMCINLDERKKCEKNNDTKLWDPEVCKCRCREIGDCSTGSYYDQNKCACMPIPVRRRFAELYSNKERPFSDRESYNLDNVGVAALVQQEEEKTD